MEMVPTRVLLVSMALTWASVWDNGVSSAPVGNLLPASARSPDEVMMRTALINQSFKGYKLFRAVPDTEQGLKVLQDLLDDPTLDFWTFPAGTLIPVDILTPPENLDGLKDTLAENKISYSIVMDDLDDKIEATMPSTDSARTPLADFTFGEYFPSAVIHKQLDQWATTYPDLVTVSSIGQSSLEKKEIKMIAIKSATLGTQPKPVVFIDGGIHAREWISPATVMYIARKLLEARDDDNTKFMLEKFDWYLVPVLNPDGYDFTHASRLNRLWRKNRAGAPQRAGIFGRLFTASLVNQLSRPLCPGVDLNRNFAYEWKQGGSSDWVCSETYAGPSAASESETQALSNYLMANKDSIKSYFSFHSYGRAILTPWGYTRQQAPTFIEMSKMGGFFRDGVAESARSDGRSSSYSLGSAANLYYVASGCSDDFAYGSAKIPYAYTIELPDEGIHGFLLPPTEIPVVGKDTFAGLVSYARELAKVVR